MSQQDIAIQRVTEQQHHAAARLVNRAHGGAQAPSAGLVDHQQVTQRVHVVHANQRGLFGADGAQSQRQMHVALDRIAVRHQVETAQFAVHRLLGNPLNGTFMDHPIVNQVGDGADLDVMLQGKCFEFGAPRHGAVVVHDFADQARRLETGHARQVAGRFGMTGARQGATRLSHEREDMARADDVFGLGVLGSGSLHSTCAVGCRDTGGHAFGGFDGNGELGAETRTVARGHQRQLEGFAALASHRHADQTTGETRHEVDVLGLHAFGGHDQVAFVFTVFVIHEDDHLALANVFDQFFDTVERHAAPPSINSGFEVAVLGQEAFGDRAVARLGGLVT